LKILVLGSNGQLGLCLKDVFLESKFDVKFLDRNELDISNFTQLKSKLFSISPDIIINASAYTAVDAAESDKINANIVNNIAVTEIALICKEINAWFFHISTDYVFDGNSSKGYIENDSKIPQTVYGKTKLDGEYAIQSSGCNYFILRTSWVFSEYGKNFLKTMIDLGSTRSELNIVSDQIGCPTYAQDIAAAINNLVLKVSNGNKYSHILHFAGHKACSWYEFSLLIFDYAKHLNIKTPKKITPVTSEKFLTAARRPKYSVLDCSKIKKIYNIEPSNWEEGIKSSLISIINAKI
jgi:dTDP-4-dehydrorhamnose reductase